MNIITSGYPYIDIDAYAGMIAYAELLNFQGKPSLAISTAPLNESITPEVLSWQAPFETTYARSPNDRYIMIDLSDPKFFEKFVDESLVSEVIDHHPGFESYWQERLGEQARIEPIGSVCTIICERWIKAGLKSKMSRVSSRLLLTAIIENTLNFGARITKDRDRAAYSALAKQAQLPDDWIKKYFIASQEKVLKDIVTALKNDTKTINFKTFSLPVTVGQLTVWDGSELIHEKEGAIRKLLESYGYPWFLNLISVSEKKSYFVCHDPVLKQWLESIFKVKFRNEIAQADRLWLRKEIITQDLIKFDK